MLSDKCIDIYEEQYPEDDCGYGEPGDKILISDNKGHLVIEPENETDETFMERLKRSKECGRNLFYEEWVPFKYKDGVEY